MLKAKEITTAVVLVNISLLILEQISAISKSHNKIKDVKSS